MHRRTALVGPVLLVIAAVAGAQTGPPPEAYVPQLNSAGRADPILEAQQLSAEPYLPVAYDFDGNADLADNADNYKRDDVSGAQEPTAYFHRAAQPASVEGIGHVVYEYWLYFAGEMLGQQQTHDWECYFVYLKEADVAGYAAGAQPPVPTQVGLSYHSHLHVYGWEHLSRFSYSDGPGNQIASLHMEGGSHALRAGVNALGGQPVPSNVDELARFFPGLSAQTWAQKASEIDGRQRGKLIRGPDWKLVQADQLQNRPDVFGTLPAPWQRAEWDQPPAASGPFAGGTRVASGDTKNIVIRPAEDPTKPDQPPQGDKPKPPEEDKPKPPEEDKPKPPQEDKPTPPPAVTPGQIAAPTVTAPRPNDRVGKRVTIEGTAAPGMLIVSSTDVIEPETGNLIKEVPGARRVVDDQGQFKMMVSCPRLWHDVDRPLRYMLKVWALDEQQRKSGIVQIPLVPE